MPLLSPKKKEALARVRNSGGGRVPGMGLLVARACGVQGEREGGRETFERVAGGRDAATPCPPHMLSYHKQASNLTHIPHSKPKHR